MNYRIVAKALGVSLNQASKLLAEYGTSPSLRNLEPHEIEVIIQRGRRLKRPNFSVLSPKEWEKIFGAPWYEIKPYMNLRNLPRLSQPLYSAAFPVIDIRAKLPGKELEPDFPGLLPKEWGGTDPFNLLMDRGHRPKLLTRKGPEIRTILGVRETMYLATLGPGRVFRATLDQWKRLVPHIGPYLKRRRDGFYIATDSVRDIRKMIRDT